MKKSVGEADVTAETSRYINAELAHFEDGHYICERRIDGIIYYIDRREDVLSEIAESITLDDDVCCRPDDERVEPAGQSEF